MANEKCDCEKWTDIKAGTGGRPMCEIPMTVKGSRGNVIPGQLPPPASPRSNTSKVHRCSVCRVDVLRAQLTAAEEDLELKELLDEGLITQAEYDGQKATIIQSL